MTTITIDRKVLEQALNALLLPCDRWNGKQFLIVNAAVNSVQNALAAPATAPDERLKELEAELAATEIAIEEYRQQCLGNAAEIERLRKDAERKPMTDKDIVRIYGLSKSTTDFARNIELFIAGGTL